ncbi:MAG: hypothetical protein Q8S00_04760 [Deltaproteobacteria bacterium]|nr:hypothetical protein [Deltaproteobacteria bacterium]
MKREYKTIKLKVIDQPKDARTPAQIEAVNLEREEREEEENSVKLDRNQVAARVADIRRLLEIFGERLDAVRFDIITHDMPPSLDHGNQVCSNDLVDMLNPVIRLYQERCEKRLPDCEDAESDLNHLKWYTADAGFMIGVLAGAIFAGASQREIDRMERGLVHATASRRWQCKE